MQRDAAVLFSKQRVSLRTSLLQLTENTYFEDQRIVTTPALDTVKDLAKNATVIPVYAELLADTETPVSVWLKLFENSAHSFLLESVTGGDVVARYSFIGGDPFMTFRANGSDWQLTGKINEKGSSDPIGKLRSIMKKFKPATVENLPRLSGGAVGYFSYDSIRLWEDIPDSNPGTEEIDEVFFGFYRDIVAFDNKEHKLLFISNIFTDEYTTIEEGYREAQFRLGTLMDSLAVRSTANTVKLSTAGGVHSNVEKEDFKKAVEKAKEYIVAGDIFQVVLSQRFSIDVDAKPFDLYRVLRTVNPSPYMYFLSLGEHSVIGASPEMLVRVENGEVEVRPIAGTCRRGKTDSEDDRLAAKLLADEKERAEHVMLVDLGRNDVGRVSKSGTVLVEDMMHIEKYSHVIHIVSNVKGQLKPEYDVFDALFSCFPAGTLSGAPKIRAMEIIDELEVSRRNIYGGALGYIDFHGNLDTCIVIRTILHKGNRANIQVGAGIVADSEPEREFTETVEKASALFAALGCAGEDIKGKR